MKPQEFNELPLGEKAIILWDRGRFIRLYEENGTYKIGMYLFSNRIISVYYHPQTKAITDIRMWTDIVNKSDILQSIARGRSKKAG
ncbi:MAG TPA: hypothetical protein VN922_17535 [Bacteroidia bacterium]|nr:hypothetical protein [Bacteroidia bacterium]